MRRRPCNTAWVLFFYDPGTYDRRSASILLVSAGMLKGYLSLEPLPRRPSSTVSTTAAAIARAPKCL